MLILPLYRPHTDLTAASYNPYIRVAVLDAIKHMRRDNCTWCCSASSIHNAPLLADPCATYTVRRGRIGAGVQFAGVQRAVKTLSYTS